MPISPDHLIRLQKRPELLRNICILAHVDHGKTSLSDNLLASNGIIAPSMQGKIRYLDSRPDEQARGITMESSAISLYFKMLKKIDGQEEPQPREYLINLIDSPGHIDFSSEVSTASRLCDGAVVVVDAVEGVCAQTVTVLRQAWVEKMKPILVINKIDRLIVEWQQTPLEAFHHLTRLIEDVNAVVGTFFQGQRMEEDLKWREMLEQEKKEFVEASDEDLYFAPERNNVVFGSAVDGWGFNIGQFAAINSRKFGIDREKLQKVLWGEYYFDPKTKRVLPGSKVKSKSLKPMFVSLVLDNIWAVYRSCVIDRNIELSEKIVNALGLKIQPRDLKSKDGRGLMLSMFGQWIPLSRAILLSVVDVLPSPLDAQRSRTKLLLEQTPSHDAIDKRVVESMNECDRTGPMTAFVSKVVAFAAKDIPKERKQQVDRIQEIREQSARQLAQDQVEKDMDDLELDDEYQGDVANPADDEEKLIGFARVYSGTLKVGQTVSILNPKYDPANPSNIEACDSVQITGLFLLMGRDMIPISEAPAGTIVGIGGLDGKILKSGTLVTPDTCGPNMAATNVTVQPILRVAVEPVDPTKIPQVERGLELLNISDPCVQVSALETGELILATAGELHLERCIKDLKERYAKVDIHCSAPIVPYRETIVDAIGGDWNEDDEEEEEEVQRGQVVIDAGKLKLTLQVYPLSKQVTKCIVQNADKICGLAAKKGDLEDEVQGAVERDAAKIDNLQTELDELLEKHKSDAIVAFGPRKVGPNILFDASGQIARRAFPADEGVRSTFEENVLLGFQMAVSRGALMAEPLEGVGCVVTKVEELAESDELVSGKLYTMTRDAIAKGIAHWSPRIMLAQYLCEIQATSEVLGKVYALINKRRGKIINEEMREGAHFYTIQASIPVAEAFGFSAEMRKRTSGSANPQLVFAGFEILDEDPFWVPTTEEELEELGDTADKENVALAYLTQIRKRKGMRTDQKLVQHGERQRTMKK